jgi:phospholipid/cholesterol/gamma-HCH transport system substrate-binding protein
LPEDQRVITCIREATSVQQLLDSMSQIAMDVQMITGDLARIVSGEMGLRQIVENLASATRRIDETIAENEQNVVDLIENVRGFSADLRDITGRDKDKIGRIASNVEELTRRLNVVAASLQEIIDPGSGGGGSASAAPGTAAAVAQASPEERERAAQQARGVRQAVDRLTGSLAKLEDVISKVNEGKGIAGKLIADERLGRKVGVAAEEIADQIDRVFKMQVQLQLRSEWLLNQTLQNEGRPGTKIYFGARLLPRPDKFYLLEVVSDPRGVDSVQTETVNTRLPDQTTETMVTTTKINEQKLTYSLQLGKRYGPVTFRIGVIENSGGGGADLHLLRDSLQLSASVYQFSRAFQDVNLAGTERMLYPRAKVWMNWYFLQHFFLTTGVDDFLNRWEQGQYPGGRSFNIGTDLFFGGGIFFTDDDLKTLLGAGAASAVSTGG